jgi:leucyl aminopeptidase (aminopeptidase T)
MQKRQPNNESAHMEENVELARQVITQCLNIAKGENIWIQTWNHTIDLASEIALACLERGAQPFITLNDENYWTRSLQEAPKEFLEALPSTKAATLEQTDAFIFMLGPKKPVDWSRIPPEKQELANIWYLESNKYVDSWRKIARKRSVRTLGIEYCLVTPERAKSFGINYEEWRRVMLAGCLADQRQIAERAAGLAKITRKSRTVNIQTSFGTNLNFMLVEREPVTGDSLVTKEDADKGIVKFLPSGFVEVAPDEDSAEGIVVYDVPIPVRGSRSIEGLTLHFSQGRVVRYSAQRGIEPFEDYIKSGQGDVDKFGFFGMGLNSGLIHGFTQDDKVLGGATIGIGGNEDKCGKNRTVGNRHWWASMSEATVKLDGKIVFSHGKLQM